MIEEKVVLLGERYDIGYFYDYYFDAAGNVIHLLHNRGRKDRVDRYRRTYEGELVILRRAEHPTIDPSAWHKEVTEDCPLWEVVE